MPYTPPDAFMLGTLAAGPTGMTLLSTLLEQMGIPYDPDCPFITYSSKADMLDGSQLGEGFSSCQWIWNALNDLQRYTLRQYCTTLSNQVYIRTETNETSSSGYRVWHTFLCQMVWMSDAEEHEGASLVQSSASDVGYTLKFTLIFRALQQQD